MTGLKKHLVITLRDTFGDRVRFDWNERILYSHDVGILPEMTRFLIDIVPDAVVMPKTAEEVAFILETASKSRTAVVPRGGGSGGYGGSLPTKRGIVVDMVLMKDVLEIDTDNKKVSVESGAVIWDIERALNAKGLGLKAYPSSAPAATIGGWVAQGGSGFGSLNYGSINNSVLSLEVVTPDGKIDKYEGDDLDLFIDFEGITGIITKVELEVNDFQEIVPVAASFATSRQLNEAMLMAANNLNPFTIIFATPEFIKFKQEVLDHKNLPEDKYGVLFAFEKTHYSVLEEKLKDIVMSNGGQIWDDDISCKEWDERFYPLRMKRKGPSVVPSEAVIPLERLGEAVEQMVSLTKDQQMGLEGIVIGNNKVAILAYFLDDERRFMYELGWSNAFTIVRIAKKFGGDIYSTGIWFANEAKRFFGKERYKKMIAFKRKVDHNSIMNPGKIIPTRIKIFPLLSVATGISIGKPLLAIGNRLYKYKPEKEPDR